MKRLLIVLFFLFLPAAGSGQEIYLETLAVRSPTALPQKGIFTITRQDIDQSTATNIADLLSQYGIVSLQRRGSFGLQGDLSIRGTTFDQGMIKVNGLIMNDPQTGHHNLDIPVPLESIKCIEVTPLAINIVTFKQPNARIKVDLLGGQHALWGGSIALKNLTYQHLAAAGWRDNTEWQNDLFQYQQAIPGSWGPSDISLGYIRKDFGAYKFYSQAFPDENETTSAFVATGQTEFFTGLWHWQPQSSFRLHRDYFILDRNRPDWSFNDHRNTTIFFGLPVTLPLWGHKLITSVDFKQDAINSTNLQQHHRNAYSVATQFFPQLGNSWQLGLGLREDFYDPDPVRRVFRPSMDINYAIDQHWLWLAEAGNFFRLPTFTELYYSDPANKGTASLEAEKGWNYQTGIKYTYGQVCWQNTVHWREIRNAIDWAKYPGETAWQARNISTVKGYGIESTFALTACLKVNYQYLNNQLAANDYQSKYNSNYLKHSASLHYSYTLPWQIKNDWAANYRQPSQLSPYTLLDLKISRRFSPHWTVYFSGTNLLNTYYEEITGIPRPGRWLLVGLDWQV
ncbi:MAG: TonB-dependent receptor [bacterium]|nr:TonB-dependent receptor [bacterium]